jgi:chromosome segregation ATPase
MGQDMKRWAAVAAAAVTLAGCQTYLDAKADIRGGGPQAREAGAQRNLQAARSETQSLQDQQLQIQRDTERMEKRLEAARADLAKSDQAVAEAQRRSRISQAEATRMRGQLAELNRDIASLDLELQAGRTRNDPEAARKEQQIRELEKRKADLERAIQLSIGS